jgi:hypothetical protein
VKSIFEQKWRILNPDATKHSGGLPKDVVAAVAKL